MDLARGERKSTTRGRCGSPPRMKGSRSPGRMRSGAPTGRVTAWDYQRATRSSRSRRAGRCAASEQPPHESDENASVGPPPFPCATTVRPRSGRSQEISVGWESGSVSVGAEAEKKRAGWRSGVTDVRPVQGSGPDPRRFFGNTVAQLGQQMTNVAIAVQVYALTQSSFYVGLVGVFALVPLISLGLYGGAISDAVDRRTVALVASAGLWLVSIALAVQAFLGNESVWLLYGCIAVQSGFYAVNNPARSAMVPRLIARDLMPAASALNMASFNLGFTFGPVIGALAIKWQGFGAAYTIDVLTFSAAYYALVRMPKMPPLANVPRAGLRSVADGLAFLRRSPNLRMTFVADLCAMVLAQPRALFPALAYKVYAGGAGVVGLLQAAPAAGAVIAFLLSGWVSKIRMQGVAIVIAVVAYGAAVGGV